MSPSLPEAKLDLLLARHAALEAELMGPVNADNYVKITRELAELNELVEAVKAYRQVRDEIGDIDAMLADPDTDPEMRAMAEAGFSTPQIGRFLGGRDHSTVLWGINQSLDRATAAAARARNRSAM